MKLNICVMLLVGYISPSILFAADSRSSIGIDINYGFIDDNYNSRTAELNDVTTAHFSFSYMYRVTDYFSLGASVVDGDSSGDIIFDLFTDSKLEYDVKRIDLRLELPSSERSSLFLELSPHQYEYKIIDDEQIVTKDDGSDFRAALGWLFKTSDNFSINIYFENMSLGPDIDLEVFGLGGRLHF